MKTKKVDLKLSHAKLLGILDMMDRYSGEANKIALSLDFKNDIDRKIIKEHMSILQMNISLVKDFIMKYATQEPEPLGIRELVESEANE